MLNHNVSVAGLHVHLLDATGHAYCTEREKLAASYRRAGEFVAETRDALGDNDDLLVLFDHGMVVDFYSNEGDCGLTLGKHSGRAFAGSTAGTVPETVFDVRERMDANASAVRARRDRLDIDEERLHDLGYV